MPPLFMFIFILVPKRFKYYQCSANKETQRKRHAIYVFQLLFKRPLPFHASCELINKMSSIRFSDIDAIAIETGSLDLLSQWLQATIFTFVQSWNLVWFVAGTFQFWTPSWDLSKNGYLNKFYLKTMVLNSCIRKIKRLMESKSFSPVGNHTFKFNFLHSLCKLCLCMLR